MDSVPTWTKAMDDECFRQDKEALTKMEAKGTKINYHQRDPQTHPTPLHLFGRSYKRHGQEWIHSVHKDFELNVSPLPLGGRVRVGVPGGRK